MTNQNSATQVAHLSAGQRQVRHFFNPAGRGDVNRIKTSLADLHDYLEETLDIFEQKVNKAYRDEQLEMSQKVSKEQQTVRDEYDALPENEKEEFAKQHQDVFAQARTGFPPSPKQVELFKQLHQMKIDFQDAAHHIKIASQLSVGLVTITEEFNDEARKEFHKPAQPTT